MEHQCKRRPWLSTFRTKLGQCASLEEIERLLRVNVRRWLGLTDLSVAKDRMEDEELINKDAGIQPQRVDLTEFLDEDELHDSNATFQLER